MAVVRDDILATIGTVIVGFGIAAFVFRIQRELQQAEARYVSWIPWADRLLIGVVTVVLLLVLFPIALAGGDSRIWAAGRLPAAACSGSVIALAGYIPALLAHYRFIPRQVWPGPYLDKVVSLVRDDLAKLVQPGLGLDELVSRFRDELAGLVLDKRSWLVRYVHVKPQLDPDKLVSRFRYNLARLDQGELKPGELAWLIARELASLAWGERNPGEPAEKAIVGASVALGVIAAVVSTIVTG